MLTCFDEIFRLAGIVKQLHRGATFRSAAAESIVQPRLRPSQLVSHFNLGNVRIFQQRDRQGDLFLDCSTCGVQVSLYLS